MKSWASSAIFGATRRESLVRAGLAIVILGAVLWILPVRRPGEEGGHHDIARPVLDPFEKAGVVELKEGQSAPGFTLGTLDGHRASVADHRDKLVVVNFWATWCQPCTLEMPSLEALWNRYRDRGLVVGRELVGSQVGPIVGVELIVDLDFGFATVVADVV